MSWRCCVIDTATGLIGAEIDVPAFSWMVSVSDSSFATSRGEGVGEDEVSAVDLSWGAVPANSQEEMAAMLSPLKSGLTLFWHADGDDPNIPGTPLLMGAIGKRTDEERGTSFPLVSMMTLLQSRYAVAEGAYGSGAGGTSPGSLAYSGMSLRGIASEVGRACTDYKPGGQLPIDWTYLGEKGAHERTYKAFDVQNLSCAAILQKISDVENGPDMQFRPYLADGRHVRTRFLAGSDAECLLGQSTVHTLAWFPGCASVQDLRIDLDLPYSRVYGSGSGTDAAKLCYLAEDLSLVTKSDPWPLMETSLSDSDTDRADLLSAHTRAQLDGVRLPRMQVSCSIDLADEGMPAPGSMWPGELVRMWIEGFPTVPDNLYDLRLMSMEGDETSRARLVFDPVVYPIW